MLQYISILLFFIGSFFLLTDVELTSSQEAFEDMSVYEVAKQLGDVPVNHELNLNIPGVSAEKGEELFHTGYTTKPNGKRTKKQSKHYVCTSCHNFSKEDPDLSNPNSEDRLTYAVKNGLPFLQGTTLHGVVNRRTFYNGDYKKKYGPETVNKVKEDLRESIQLCAVGCAQGRALDTWEIESVLAYFWSLELTMGDLNLSANEKVEIENALNGTGDVASTLSNLKKEYPEMAPATFHKTPENWKEGYKYEGNPENGETIYQISCLHCHEHGRYSYYSLDTGKLSLKHLDKHFPLENSPYSSYKLISEGTLPVMGDKAYMPQYPLERLSMQQIEDLRAYVSTQ